MQYDKYELRIQKIEKFFKMFFRHLGKIVVAVSLLALTAAALLATRGIITVSAESIPTSIVYGETPQYEASAFLSDVTYEYCSVGSEDWSEEIPQVPGKYYVRAVAKATFGYRRSTPQAFEIQKKEAYVSIASSKVAYGSEPKVEAELVYQDQIADVTFAYNENRDHADIASVVIVDEQGNDVTDRYEIITEGRSIQTVPRPVTIEIEDAEQIYDGTAFSSKEYSITDGSLADGDQIEVTFASSLTDVGRIRNVADYQIFNAQGEDVTKHYDITEKVGYLAVLPREVSIQTEDLSVTYDAAVHTKEDYFFISELALAEGHTLEINGWSSIIDAGTKQNSFGSFCIWDQNGKDVTENYLLTQQWGTLTVLRKAITIESLSAEKFYDASPFGNPKYRLPNEEELLSGHTIDISNYVTLTDAGTLLNEIECIILSEDRLDVTKNYIISYNYGTLLVKKLDITVTSNGNTFTYNGSAHSESGFFVTGGTILEGQHPEIDTVTYVTDAGEYANDITVKILDGTKDVSKNYHITYQSGTLLVKKLDITVTTHTSTWTYDGTAHSKQNYYAPDLLMGHQLKNIVSASITNVGSTDNEFFSYELVDATGRDVSGNYTVTIVPGVLTVEKRQIVVSTESKNKVYDGTALLAPSWIVILNTQYHDLVEGHTIVAPTPTGSQTGVGFCQNEYTGSPEDILIFFGEENVTANYEIVEIRIGQLQVTARPISIVTNGAVIVYDGKEHKDDTLNVTNQGENSGLANGHSFDNVVANTFCDVTNAVNKVTFVIVDENKVDVSANYQITIQYDWIKITPRPITVTTNGYNDVYDGKDHSDNTLNVTNQGKDSGLCDGHELKATGDAPIFRDVVSNRENTFSFEIQCDGRIIDKANYNITFIPGTVTITRRPITVSSDSYDEVYDGFVHSFNTVYVDNQGEKSGLCEDVGHRFDRVSTRSYENVTQGTKNTIGFIIVDADGRSVQQNYQITRNFGTVVIRPRPITVSTEGYDDIYDGLDHWNETLTVENQGEASGLCIDAMHNFSQIRAQIFNDVVRGEENRVSFIIYDYLNSRDVTKNYEITYQYGEVTIKPRPITVSTEDYDDVYDGKEHSDDTLKVENQGEKSGLCQLAGHRFDEVVAPVFKNVITNAKNEVTFIITNGTEDVTRNYEITYQYGDVTIKPRPITVSTEGYHDVYDGKEHSDDTLKVENQGEKSGLCLDAGHGFDKVVAPVFKNVITNAKNNVTFIIADGKEDVSANYEITYQYGDVHISKRPITVSTNGYDEVYDGREHSDDTLKVENQGEKSGLCLEAGHGFDKVVAPVFKNVITNAKNNVTFIITDGKEDVSANYEITYQYGDVKIDRKVVSIQTASDAWGYDGQPHTNVEYQCLDGTSFLDFHVPLVKNGTETYITKVGKVENRFEIIVFDENGDQCTENYDIQFTKYGILEVTKRPISIGTSSAKKVYDGTPLQMHKTYVTETSEFPLLDGDEIRVEFTATITEVGSIPNTFDPDTLRIYCGEEDVTDCYEIDPNYVFGTLEILAPKTDEDESGNKVPGHLDLDGNIGAPPLDSDGDGEPDEAVPVFVVTTDRTGTIYLKVMSFGAYEGQGWAKATEYGSLILDYASAQYLTAFAMENYGTPAQIKILSLNGEYVLPYYASAHGSSVQVSDTYMIGDTDAEYYLSYFEMDRWKNMSVPEALRAFEEEYSKFVHQQYTAIDQETDAYMQKLIKEKGFRKDDPNIIPKVANYIQNAAIYSLKYNRALDQESNIVVAFLSEYQVGVCQHYAASATMLYRALGIPARYTIGYMVDAEADVETVVSSGSAHAWVEVYVDGLGWIQVEVTGAAMDENDPQNKLIQIQPINKTKEYDGTPLTYDGQVLLSNQLLNTLVKIGYTYEVTVSGTQTKVGASDSIITSFTLYDPQGNDVTDQYEIQTAPGKLEVVPANRLIEIFLLPKSYEYTGSEYSYTKDDCIVRTIADGVTLKIKTINISMTEVGVLNSALLNSNLEQYLTFEVYAEGSSENIAHLFRVKILDYRTGKDYQVLCIKPRLLELATLSATKTYDGTELTQTEVVLSKGLLAPGHRVYLEVIGSQTEIGSSDNTAIKDSFRVYYLDENGNEVDMTHNYTIYREDDIYFENPCISLGKLTVI